MTQVGDTFKTHFTAIQRFTTVRMVCKDSTTHCLLSITATKILVIIGIMDLASKETILYQVFLNNVEVRICRVHAWLEHAPCDQLGYHCKGTSATNREPCPLEDRDPPGQFLEHTPPEFLGFCTPMSPTPLGAMCQALPAAQNPCQPCPSVLP